jgi:hypothetical protein
VREVLTIVPGQLEELTVTNDPAITAIAKLGGRLIVLVDAPAALKARPARAITERHYAHTLIEDRDLVLRRARALMLRVAGARVLRPPEARALGRRGLARRRVTLWQDAHTTPAGMRRFVVLRRL